MPTGPMIGFLRNLHQAALLHEGGSLTDAELLEAFLAYHDESAFAVLVRCHGPMVWGVCRRMLRNHQDAEDAFQATFLVLIRKAASIASRELVANWLYGVAQQTARKARATAAKRGRREMQMTGLSEPTVPSPPRCHDWQAVLDQALSCLPAKYRAVIVLCDLKGKTRKEAASHFQIPEGTVASRLAAARAMLARRLARQGGVLSGGVLAAVLAEQGAVAGTGNRGHAEFFRRSPKETRRVALE